jgi:metal-responsive CopG/Arc/MetJ family transcriptional regulator
LIKEIDKVAQAEYTSHSEFIRSCIVEKLKRKEQEDFDRDYAKDGYRQDFKISADR